MANPYMMMEEEAIALGYTRISPGIYKTHVGEYIDVHQKPITRQPLIRTAGPTIRPAQNTSRLPAGMVQNANINYRSGVNYVPSTQAGLPPKLPLKQQNQYRGGYTPLPITQPKTEVVYRTPMITVTRQVEEPPIPTDMNKPSGMVTHNPFQKREFQPGPLQVFDGQNAGAVYASKPRPLVAERVPQQKKTPIITNKEDSMIIDQGLFLGGVQTGLLPADNFIEVPHSDLQNHILNTQHQDIINEMESQPPHSSAPTNAPLPQTPLIISNPQHPDIPGNASKWTGTPVTNVPSEAVFYRHREGYKSPYFLDRKPETYIEKQKINNKKLQKEKRQLKIDNIRQQNLPTTQPTLKQSNLDAVSKIQQDQQMAQYVQNNHTQETLDEALKNQQTQLQNEVNFQHQAQVHQTQQTQEINNPLTGPVFPNVTVHQQQAPLFTPATFQYETPTFQQTDQQVMDNRLQQLYQQEIADGKLAAIPESSESMETSHLPSATNTEGITATHADPNISEPMKPKIVYGTPTPPPGASSEVPTTNIDMTKFQRKKSKKPKINKDPGHIISATTTLPDNQKGLISATVPTGIVDPKVSQIQHLPTNSVANHPIGSKIKIVQEPTTDVPQDQWKQITEDKNKPPQTGQVTGAIPIAIDNHPLITQQAKDSGIAQSNNFTVSTNQNGPIVIDLTTNQQYTQQELEANRQRNLAALDQKHAGGQTSNAITDFQAGQVVRDSRLLQSLPNAMKLEHTAMGVSTPNQRPPVVITNPTPTNIPTQIQFNAQNNLVTTNTNTYPNATTGQQKLDQFQQQQQSVQAAQEYLSQMNGGFLPTQSVIDRQEAEMNRRLQNVNIQIPSESDIEQMIGQYNPRLLQSPHSSMDLQTESEIEPEPPRKKKSKNKKVKNKPLVETNTPQSAFKVFLPSGGAGTGGQKTGQNIGGGKGPKKDTTGKTIFEDNPRYDPERDPSNPKYKPNKPWPSQRGLGKRNRDGVPAGFDPVVEQNNKWVQKDTENKHKEYQIEQNVRLKDRELDQREFKQYYDQQLAARRIEDAFRIEQFKAGHAKEMAEGKFRDQLLAQNYRLEAEQKKVETLEKGQNYRKWLALGGIGLGVAGGAFGVLMAAKKDKKQDNNNRYM